MPALPRLPQPGAPRRGASLGSRRPWFLLALGALLAAPGAGSGGSLAAPSPPEIYVYAAASLRDALQKAAPACSEAAGVRVVFNFGASSDLARQIEAAGKADVFFSADEEWMDFLAGKGRVDSLSRRSFLSNRLVVVGPRGTSLRVASARDLAGKDVRRIALANPESVPAGKYARRWLEREGEWEAVKERIVPAIDVRAALAAVESGAVDAGVVYRTDAAITGKVRVLHVVQGKDAPRILYSVAALGDRPRLPLARRFVRCLAEAPAKKVFRELGFIVEEPAP